MSEGGEFKPSSAEPRGWSLAKLGSNRGSDSSKPGGGLASSDGRNVRRASASVCLSKLNFLPPQNAPAENSKTDTDRSPTHSPRGNQSPPAPPPIPNIDPSILNTVNVTGSRSVPSLPPRKYQGGLHQSANNPISTSPSSPNRLTQSQTNPIQRTQPGRQENDPDSWLYEDDNDDEVAGSAELIDLMEQTFRTQSRNASLMLMDDIIDHCVSEEAPTSMYPLCRILNV